MIVQWYKNRKNKIKAEKLKAFNELIELLSKSEDSGFAVATIKEITTEVISAKKSIEVGGKKSAEKIQILFAPTGALQDTSIDNGWGDKYLELADRLC